jgi:hypothetical protein
MADPLAGGIEAKNVNFQADFKAASSAGPKPFITFPVKPEAASKIISNLDALKGRTDDSAILKENTATGGTKYSFMDTRTNTPLAVMNTQNGQASLSLYKSSEDLAKRIDSAFVKTEDVRNFIAEVRADSPTQVASLKQ